MKVLTPEDLAHVESLTHHQRWEICQTLPDDYHPYGQNMARQTDDPEIAARYRGDCSCGCWWYNALDYDWGICRNPASHRYQFLTFEHQGCLKFDPGPIWQDEAAASP